VGLRAYAQRDPLVEYQREGYAMFNTMMDGIKEETVGFLFNLDVQVEEAPAPEPAPATVGGGDGAAAEPAQEPQVEIRAKGLGRAPQMQGLQYTAPTIDGAAGSGGVQVAHAPALGIGGPAPATVASGRRVAPGQVVSGNGPSRNAPCPCGSGKKYKRCHGAPASA